MKFEHLLHAYWANHFLFNGRINSLKVTLYDFFRNIGGLGYTSKSILIKRFEFFFLVNNFKQSFKLYPNEVLRGVNILLSQLSTINNQISELRLFSVIKLYLIRTYRGKSHSIGKPVRGQRTWSNAWSSYKSNQILREFITIFQRIRNKNYQEDVIDYKKLTRKYRKKNLKDISAKKMKKLVTLWF